MARPARVALTVLGTVIGVAALVATLGLSKTAGNQIVGRFDQVAATDVVVTPVPAAQRAGGAAVNVIPWDAEARMKRLNGVAQAGTLGEVNVRGAARALGADQRSAQGQTDIQLPVRAASPGLWPAVRAKLVAGRLPDAGHSARGDRVAVLGINAARRLGITNLDQQPAIFIGDRLYQVIGLVGGVRRQVSLLGSLTIPNGTARREFGARRPELGADRDRDRRGRADRAAGARGAQPHRPEPAAGRGAAGPRAAARATWRTTSTPCSCCSAASRCSWARSASRT